MAQGANNNKCVGIGQMRLIGESAGDRTKAVGIMVSQRDSRNKRRIGTLTRNSASSDQFFVRRAEMTMQNPNIKQKNVKFRKSIVEVLSLSRRRGLFLRYFEGHAAKLTGEMFERDLENSVCGGVSGFRTRFALGPEVLAVWVP